MPDIALIDRIRDAVLVGRGGAAFPVYRKWQAVREAKGARKYVVMNVSEREPNVDKDFHILHWYPQYVFEGMKYAMDFIGTKEAYINFNARYEEKLRPKVDPHIERLRKQGYRICVYKEAPPTYIGGEETAMLNAIEGKRVEPRLKPPYPVESGLFGMPTLIHNVETLYDVGMLAARKYAGYRYYTVSGEAPNSGVFHLPADWNIRQILEKTENIPEFPYFVQAGGGASGTVWHMDQAGDHEVGGTGAILIYRLAEDPRAVMLGWLEFYARETCGKCTPCREGTHQLLKMVEESAEIPWDRMEPVLDVLAATSFCALGRSVPVPLRSYRDNVLPRR